MASAFVGKIRELKKHLAQIALGLALGLVFLGHAAEKYTIPLFSTLDAFVYDAHLRLTMKGGIDERIVIVDIDEKSLAEIGRWPWNRKKMADVVTKLFGEYGVAILGFDVIFAEPDTSSGLPSLETIARTRLREDIDFQSALAEMRKSLDYDRRFAESMRGKPIVLAYSFTNNARQKGVLPEPAVSDGTFSGKKAAFASWNGYGASLPIFQSVAAGAGHINPLPDGDGISRRVPMLAEYQGRYYESLSLAMARMLLDNPLIVPGFPAKIALPNRYHDDLEWLDLSTEHRNVRIPVDRNATSLIPYRGLKGSFRYVSAADVLTGRANSEWLKGKIVVFGASAPGLVDLRATPVGSDYPGVEIHANMLAGILDGSIKARPTYLVGAEVLLLSCCVVLLAVLLPVLPPFRATLLTSFLLLAVIALNIQLWSSGLVMPLVATVGAILALYVQDMSWGYFFESRNKRKLTKRFGQYVPPELVDKMIQDPDLYSMEGKNEELTVLFSDVRSFTSISERLDPKELARLMNEYLDSMTQAIQRNHGTLDKYMGDAIMAFWGAPVADADHARHAVLTALEMQTELRKLDKPFIERGWPPLKIGIGINTGNMTVGDMGSRVRQAYTVMGDAVNLGSRLEELTKQYHVGIIVSESTRERAQDLVYRELDRVRVKGKDESVAIFEPLCQPDQLDARLQEELRSWDRVLHHYRSREWDQAERELQALLQENTEYHPYLLYAKRIAHYRENPPNAEWDGVTTFETK